MSTTLDTGVPLTLVNAATATGTAKALLFTVQPRGEGGARVLALQAIGAGAMPTTVTAALECSADGGTTWQTYGTASGIALVATATGTTAIVLNLVAGLIYRINLTSYTAGSATSTSVTGFVS